MSFIGDGGEINERVIAFYPCFESSCEAKLTSLLTEASYLSHRNESGNSEIKPIVYERCQTIPKMSLSLKLLCVNIYFSCFVSLYFIYVILTLSEIKVN